MRTGSGWVASMTSMTSTAKATATVAAGTGVRGRGATGIAAIAALLGATITTGCAQVQEAVEGPAPLATAERLVTPAPAVLAPGPCTVDVASVLGAVGADAAAAAGGWPPLVAGSMRLDLGTPVTVPQSPRPVAAGDAGDAGDAPGEPEPGEPAGDGPEVARDAGAGVEPAWTVEHVVRLGDLVDVLQSRGAVPVEVRWNEVTAAGTGPDLGLDLPAGTVTLGVVMEAVVRASEREAAATGGAGAVAADDGGGTLAWAIGDRRLLLTTLADARRRAAAWSDATLIERRYPLASTRAAMIAVHRAEPGFPALRQAAARTVAGGTGRPSDDRLAEAARRLVEAEPPVAAAIDAELAALDDLLAAWLVRPEATVEALAAGSIDALRDAMAGGAGPRTVRLAGETLVVRATPGQHERIAALMDELALGCRLPRMVAEAAGTAAGMSPRGGASQATASVSGTGSADG